MRRLDKLLTEWLPRQRWFAGKGRAVVDITIAQETELVAGDPGLRHMIVAVRQTGPQSDDDQTPGEIVDLYQLLLGSRRELPGRLEYAEIGSVNGVHLYDAVHDPELTRALLSNIAAGADIGALSFRAVPGTRINTELDSLASPAEQSNTSLVFGESYICKLFRRVTPGVNPDLEINLGLSRIGSKHIPAPYGWVETTLDGEPTTLAMLSEYLRTATDGWQLATTSVRDLYAEADLHAHEVGGDFAAEAERLGTATAAVHRDLVTAFGENALPAEDVHALAELMVQRLDETRAAVPEVARYRDTLEAVFGELANHNDPIPVQRVHGDLHLGQVMRTEAGWLLLDFEGEPARPLRERQRLSSPLRDVAGMLRSFEYAARHLLGGHPNKGQLEYRAREWADRNREAFCRGYFEAGGTDPATHQVLLRAFEFDKAIYEVMYEARSRPSWLHIPLGSLARLAA